jgi:phage gpG-like protein
LKDLQAKLERLATELPRKALMAMEVEGNKFINKNFQDQGFNGSSLEPWQARKTTDRQGRDLTRYRTNRVGSQGSLTQFGQREVGRAILTGWNNGGDKLRNSFRSRIESAAVVFYTYKAYAEYHNEGTDILPKRAFIANSPYLDTKINDKITSVIQDILR